MNIKHILILIAENVFPFIIGAIIGCIASIRIGLYFWINFQASQGNGDFKGLILLLLTISIVAVILAIFGIISGGLTGIISWKLIKSLLKGKNSKK